MFAKYKIDIKEVISSIGGLQEVKSVLSNPNFQQWITDQYSAYPGDILNPLVYGQNGVIRADIVSDEQFPILKDKQVFISHSSKDGDIAKVLAWLLHTFCGINCFIDSMLWNNIADLQKELDGKYCWLREKDKIYDYNKRNYSTAHVHAMLSTALFEMIDSCECAIFIESNNSTIKLEDINDCSTFSPWIYEEINFINKIRVNPPVRFERRRQVKAFSIGGTLNESINIPVVYPLRNLKDMSAIDVRTLIELYDYSQKLQQREQLDKKQLAEHVLDTLYINTGRITRSWA